MLFVILSISIGVFIFFTGYKFIRHETNQTAQVSELRGEVDYLKKALPQLGGGVLNIPIQTSITWQLETVLLCMIIQIIGGLWMEWLRQNRKRIISIYLMQD